MVLLVDQTEDDIVYFNFNTNSYIVCTRSYPFPHKVHEQWPAQTPEYLKKCKRLRSYKESNYKYLPPLW